MSPDRQPRPTYTVTDLEALDALAHPVRMHLMRLLRSEGPATASGLAERIGESSGVTSYHLRKLAEVGLVAEDVGRGTKRERWWTSVHTATSYSPADFLGKPEAHRSTVSMRREILRWQTRLIDNWLSEEAEWPEAWVRSAYSSDDLLVLTPDQAAALGEELWGVVQRYRDAAPTDVAQQPDAERVVWLTYLVPTAGELPR